MLLFKYFRVYINFISTLAAPVIQAASLHSEAKEPNRAYLYLFKHVTKKGYYPEVSDTVKPRFWNIWSATKVFQNRVLFQNY